MDIKIVDHGTVVQLIPLTDAGKAFLRDELESESWQWLGHTLNIDPRYTGTVVMLAEDKGVDARTEAGFLIVGV